jgi:hypothetical protein
MECGVEKRRLQPPFSARSALSSPCTTGLLGHVPVDPGLEGVEIAPLEIEIPERLRH